MPQPPQPQLMPLIFEGLDTFTDPKRGIATKLDLLENCYVSTPFKLQKRQGFTSQTKTISGGGGSLASGQRLIPYRDELLMTDGAKLYSKSSVAAAWIAKAKMPTGTIVSEKITGDGISTTRFNVAAGTASGLTLWAWQQRSVNSMSITIIENATGAVINTGTIVGSMPRIVSLSGLVFLTWYDTATSKLQTAKLDPATPTQLVSTATIDTQATLTTYDVAPDANTGKLIVTWWYSADAIHVHLRTVTPSSMALGTNTTFTHGMAGPPTIRQLVFLTHDYSDGKAYLVVGAPTLPRQDTWDINTTTLVASNQTTNVLSATGAVTGYFDVGSSTKTLLGEILGASSDLTDIKGFYSAGAISFTLIKGLGIGGRIFKQGTKWYLPVFYEDTIQRSRFLLEYEHATVGGAGGTSVVGFLGSNDDGGVGGGQTGATTVPCLSDPINYGSGVWGLPSHYSFDLGAHYGIQSHRVTFTEANCSPGEDYADVKMFGGMQLNAYDGAYCVEQGFYLKPQAPTTAVNVAAGGKNGNYLVKLVYSWTDSRGRLWRSVPGPASISLLTGANQRIDVTVNNLRITNKDPKFNLQSTVPLINIEIYCTVNNGTTYYLETTVTNDVTANTTLYSGILGLTDAALQANELLYTTGGVVQNDPIPRPRLLRKFGPRLFACLDRGEVWHTKELSEGEGAAWSFAKFRIPLDTSAGIITALMDMDQQMLFGQRNGVYLLGGGDPTDEGTNLFGSPTRINTDVGPVDQTSVVRLPNGIGYNSPRGIFMMSRGLDSQPVGQQVQRYTQTDTITGAVVCDGVNQARWVTSNGDMLVYDHVIGQWFVWTGLAAVATCLWQNMHAILASDGTVKLETAGVFSDDSTAIVMKIRTAWISLAGVAGYKRLWDVLIIGEYKGAHTLQMGLEYNFSQFTNETLSINAGSFSYDIGIEASYVWEAQPKQQLCTSVRLTVQDVLSGAGTEGFYLSAMALNVGLLAGGVRVASNHGLS